MCTQGFVTNPRGKITFFRYAVGPTNKQRRQRVEHDTISLYAIHSLLSLIYLDCDSGNAEEDLKILGPFLTPFSDFPLSLIKKIQIFTHVGTKIERERERERCGAFNAPLNGSSIGCPLLLSTK